MPDQDSILFQTKLHTPLITSDLIVRSRLLEQLNSGIEFLRLKNIEGKALALGDLNKETQFVLDYFKVTEPEKVNELPHNSENYSFRSQRGKSKCR